MYELHLDGLDDFYQRSPRLYKLVVKVKSLAFSVRNMLNPSYTFLIFKLLVISARMLLLNCR